MPDALPVMKPNDVAKDYVVLARKYRSRTFGELIGQEALVRTLTNAIVAGKLHHAYVLTGIRGTGKTSTARLLAMALNCEGGPAVTWAEDDAQVAAIRAGVHPDVLEYDAASNRGVDDVQKLFEGVAYAPLQGNFKVYIIDEVHMLSNHAFNALLKTLEEPPPRVKFVFATTDVQKVPLTILSRCQRFDLKRVPVPVLQGHFEAILQKEGLQAEAEAVQLIARAADGSVRDGLSLLDQAVALSEGGVVQAEAVREMLGLAGEAALQSVLEPVLKGDAPAAWAAVEGLYAAGHEAVAVLQGLLGKLHLLTRLKLVPGLADSPQLTERERRDLGPLAKEVNLAVLNRTYQVLLQGVAEVKQVDAPHEALGMVVVRAAHLAQLPAGGVQPVPQQAEAVLARMASGGAGDNGRAVEAQVAAAEPKAAGAMPVRLPAGPTDWAGVVKLVQVEKPALAAAIRQQVRCLRVVAERGGPLAEIQLEPGLFGPEALLRELRAALQPHGWAVQLAAADTAATKVPTLAEQAAAAHGEATQAVQAHPDVQAVLGVFPGAVLESLEGPEETLTH